MAIYSQVHKGFPNTKVAVHDLAFRKRTRNSSEKFLALMDCDAKLYRSKQRLTGNPIDQFHVNDKEIDDDLLNLGLTPRKSLTMQFPDVPDCI